MPGMDLTLTWALPVKVEVLGAHLQAYLETLPTIGTLRLCNRFGTGPHAYSYINKLPVELVQHVEAALVEPVRQQHVLTWALDLRCFEQTCDVEDHWSRDDLLEMYWDIIGYSEGLDDGESRKDPTTAEIIERLDVYDTTRWVSHVESHQESRDKWRERVGCPAYSERGFFAKHQAQFNKSFGLKIWFSHVRLEPASNPRYDDWEPCETTVAYLTLPNRGRRIEEWHLSEGEVESGGFAAETGYGISVNVNQPPTARSLQRFSRALKILGLRVFLHASQKGPALSSTDAKPDVAVDDGAGALPPQWPRLLLLTRARSIGL